MLSEEKVSHLTHLMLDGVWKADMVDFPNEEQAMREAKKILLTFISRLTDVSELATKKIQSQKNPPPKNSPQWEVLYNKYYEEELRKHGG